MGCVRAALGDRLVPVGLVVLNGTVFLGQCDCAIFGVVMVPVDEVGVFVNY